MALTLADVGADEILGVFFNNADPAGGRDLTLKLFSNDITPADTDTDGTYTEVTGGGYAAKALTNGSWTISIASDPSNAGYAQQTFTFTGAIGGSGNIYGYFVVDADGTLIWAEKLGALFTPTSNGDNVKITPTFELSKGTPT